MLNKVKRDVVRSGLEEVAAARNFVAFGSESGSVIES